MPVAFELADLNIPKDSELHKLLERCPDIVTARFGDDEYLVKEGDPSKEVFIVLRGAYVVERTSANALATVLTEDPSAPSFVGEMAYLSSGVRTASVRSSASTYALCLKPQHLGVIIDEFPLFTRILCAQFAQRLKEADTVLEDYQRLFAMEMVQLTKGPGEVIFANGDRADSLYQLVDGVLVREDGDTHETITPADTFMGFIDPLPYFCDGQYQSTVKAQTGAILVAIASSSKLAVIRHTPQLVLNCLRA